MPQPRILVIGGGSIGERHLRCFIQTGQARVSICEPREERMAFLTETYDVDEAVPDFAAADLPAFDGVVICTPPNLHIAMPRAERDDYFVWQAEHFLAAMRGDKHPMTSLKEGKEVVQMCMAARESYESKRIIMM